MIENKVLRAAIAAALATAPLGALVVMSSGPAMAAHAAQEVKLALADGRTLEVSRGPNGPQTLIDGRQAPDGLYQLQSGGRIKIGPPASREDIASGHFEINFYLHFQTHVPPNPPPPSTPGADRNSGGVTSVSMTHPDKLPPGVAARIRALESHA